MHKWIRQYMNKYIKIPLGQHRTFTTCFQKMTITHDIAKFKVNNFDVAPVLLPIRIPRILMKYKCKNTIKIDIKERYNNYYTSH